jgi:hypothetical protein
LSYQFPARATSTASKENAAAAAISLSADTAEVLARVFPPGAAAGLRYPESHLARLGI